MIEPADGSLTVADAARRYLGTLKPNDPAQGDILQFIRWLEGDRPLQGLRGHDVASWTESLGTSSPLNERRVESVRAFLGYLRKQGLTESNLATHIRYRRSASSRNSKAGRSVSLVDDGPRQELTPEGHRALLEELDQLKAQRPLIAQDLSRAMADKDFRENSPLDAARDKQAHLEARIREIEETLRVSQVVQTEKSEFARLGSTVRLEKLGAGVETVYTLVSPNEVNPSEGKISVASPLGKAVVDHRVGEEVQVVAPSGVVRYRIAGVET